MAKEFKVSVPHQLERDVAVDRVKGLVAQLKSEYGDQVSEVEETWIDNRCDFSLKISRFRLSGSIEVHSASAEIKGTLPFAARLFEKQAREMIGKRAAQLLS